VACKQECLLEIERLEQQGHIEVYYGDESGFSLTPVTAYCWQYPKEEVRIFPQKSKRVNLFGLMSKDNRLTSFHKEGPINTRFVVDCLSEWVETLSKPTVLILDNAPIHQAKSFRAHRQQWQEQNLFIFFLPNYSPHLNKIEILWRKLKYEWLKPDHYASLPLLKGALATICSQFGQQYKIDFS
jgi:transposase